MLLYHVILGIMGLTWLFEKSARLGVSESHCAGGICQHYMYSA